MQVKRCCYTIHCIIILEHRVKFPDTQLRATAVHYFSVPPTTSSMFVNQLNQLSLTFKTTKTHFIGQNICGTEDAFSWIKKEEFKLYFPIKSFHSAMALLYEAVVSYSWIASCYISVSMMESRVATHFEYVRCSVGEVTLQA